MRLGMCVWERDCVLMCGQSAFNQKHTLKLYNNRGKAMRVRRILQWSNTDSDEDCHSATAAAVAAAIDTHSIRIQIDVHSFINLTGLCLSGMCSNNRSLITAQWIVFATQFYTSFPSFHCTSCFGHSHSRSLLFYRFRSVACFVRKTL